MLIILYNIDSNQRIKGVLYSRTLRTSEIFRIYLHSIWAITYNTLGRLAMCTQFSKVRLSAV